MPYVRKTTRTQENSLVPFAFSRSFRERLKEAIDVFAESNASKTRFFVSSAYSAILWRLQLSNFKFSGSPPNESMRVLCLSSLYIWLLFAILCYNLGIKEGVYRAHKNIHKDLLLESLRRLDVQLVMIF